MSDTRTLDTVPSDAATYSGQKTFGVIAGRSHVEISPKYGGDFKAGDVIRLEIPAQAYLDPNEFYIHMRTSIFGGTGRTDGVTSTPGKYNDMFPINAWSGSASSPIRLKGVQFVPGIQSIFNRMRLLAGSVVLEDIQDYNVLYRTLLETTSSSSWREGDGFMNEGVYNPADYQQKVANNNFHCLRTNYGQSNPGHYYSFRPLFGLFAAGKYIPLKYMGQLTIELYLENDQECLWSSTSADLAATPGASQQAFTHASPATYLPSNMMPAVASATVPAHLAGADSSLILVDFPAASYIVQEVRMHVPFVHPIESFDQAMMRQIEAGDVAIFHSSWSTTTRQISAPTKTSLSFQERALSLKGAIACMRNNTSIRQIDEDFSFPANGIKDYQWKLGSEYIPAQPVNCLYGAGRALAELRKGLGLYGNDDAENMLTEFNFLPVDPPHQLDTMNLSELRRGASEPGSFFMALDLEKSAGQASGFDSAASSVDIELLLNLTPHVDVVGKTLTAPQYAPSQRWAGAKDFALFQPSKKRVTFPKYQATTLASRDSWGDKLVIHSTGLATSATERHLSECPDGFMIDKNLVYSLPVTAYADYDGSQLTLTDNAKGNYARVYFFAHIDQVLRLSAVGRMEIVR